MSILVLKNISPENQARVLGFVIAENIACSTSISAAELREYADEIQAEDEWESSDYDSDWTPSDTSCM